MKNYTKRIKYREILLIQKDVSFETYRKFIYSFYISKLRINPVDTRRKLNV